MGHLPYELVQNPSTISWDGIISDHIYSPEVETNSTVHNFEVTLSYNLQLTISTVTHLMYSSID